MTIDNPWSKHYQSVWHERTSDRRFPLWARVAFLAFGNHRANGHARFKPGEISLLFGRVDAVTGELKPVDKANVQRAIRGAIDAGWLAAGSSSLCLVVLAHAISGGIGSDREQCPIHHPGARRTGGRAAPKATSHAV